MRVFQFITSSCIFSPFTIFHFLFFFRPAAAAPRARRRSAAAGFFEARLHR